MKKIYLFIIGLLLLAATNSNASMHTDTDPTMYSDSMVFAAVEEMPIFPGGEKALLNFLTYHIQYPRDAIENGIEGRVWISFVVEIDGSISNAKVERGIGYHCDEEALRVINKFPKYTPGKQNGLPVRVQVMMPITFRLSS